MNKSEKFVYKICKESFLSLWSYANPRGKDNKELCDILVVCDPDIIIFSVKEKNIKDMKDFKTEWERYKKRVFDKSFKQIYGAERWIRNNPNVIKNNGEAGLPFPSNELLQIHRISVALGGEDKMPLIYGDFGKGFIHVFDSISFRIILEELNTISDFIHYMKEKEKIFREKMKIDLEGAEEDLLAFYLKNNRSFPKKYDHIFLGEELWKQLSNSEQYKKKKEADRISYIWDNLIEIFCRDFELGNIEFGNSLTNVENVIRYMARENRFARRMLGKAFWDFHLNSIKKRIRSRIAVSLSDIKYVFMAVGHDEDREDRKAELGARCFVVRGLIPESKIIIGIATEKHDPNKGFSLDAVYFEKPEWTEEDQKQMKIFQNEYGFFRNPQELKISEDEYPE